MRHCVLATLPWFRDTEQRVQLVSYLFAVESVDMHCLYGTLNLGMTVPARKTNIVPGKLVGHPGFAKKYRSTLCAARWESQLAEKGSFRLTASCGSCYAVALATNTYMAVLQPFDM